MKKKLLGLKRLTIEGNNGNYLKDLDFLLLEGECICLVSAAHQKEVLVEYLQGEGHTVSGSLFLGGKEILQVSKEAMEREKVFVISRKTPYMSTLTIEENIFVLRRNSLKKFRLNEKAMELQTRYYFEKYGLDMDLRMDSSRLSVGDKIIIGVIRSISQGAKVIVLSDVYGAFFKTEVNRLISLIQGLKKEGIGVLVSDNYPEYFYPAADQLVIFKHMQIAKKIYDQQEFNLGYDIIMRGARHSAGGEQRLNQGKPRAVKIKGFTLDKKTCQITGSRGEIVLVSEDGAKLDLLWSQFMRFSDKEITYILDGRKILYKDMADLISQKIAFLNPEISYGGVMNNLSWKDNILMPSYRKISSKLGFYKKQSDYILKDNFLFQEEENKECADMGENMWKSVFYRWKLYNPRVLILYNTLTVADVRQRDWIKILLTGMADRGTTIILLETEASYCAGIADRIETMEYDDED